MDQKKKKVAQESNKEKNTKANMCGSLNTFKRCIGLYLSSIHGLIGWHWNRHNWTSLLR
jgi:hypothetical protein